VVVVLAVDVVEVVVEVVVLAFDEGGAEVLDTRAPLPQAARTTAARQSRYAARRPTPPGVFTGQIYQEGGWRRARRLARFPGDSVPPGTAETAATGLRQPACG